MSARLGPVDAFARAAARLAGRAAHLAEMGAATTAAQEALRRASLAAEEVERLAREGGDLEAAYLRAAGAMDAAADALDEVARHDRPWVHFVPGQKNPRRRGV